MKFFNWINIRLILMFALVIFLFSFTSKRNEKRHIVKSVVLFSGEGNRLVTNEMVNKLLIENKSDARSIRKDKLDLKMLERSINEQEMIEKSEVFVSIDGVLKAVVKQKTPIARVFNETESFYLDSKGNRMPLSEIFAERVPLVTGDITGEEKERLGELFNTIHNDEFLKKNIIGVEISPSGGIVMKNRNYDYAIDFGRAIHVERKFNNYKAFFQKAVSDSTINNYKKINLKFTQQVVCTK